MKKNRIALSSVVLTISLAQVGLSPANADTLPNNDPVNVVSTKTHISADCLAQIQALTTDSGMSVDQTICTTSSTLYVSDENTVTLAEVQGLSNSLSPQSFRSLMVAAVAGTVKSKTYLQSMNHGTDGETQTGKFYYDGARAWVSTTYRGYTGTHVCRVDWSIGFLIYQVGCSDSGSLSTRNLDAQWGFQPLALPIYWEETYRINVDATGYIYQ